MHLHKYFVFLIVCSVFIVIDAEARGASGGSHSRSTSSYRSHSTIRSYHSSSRPRSSYSRRSSTATTGRQLHISPKHRSSYSPAASRDSHGRIKRSQTARHDFMKQTGYSRGRKGYVIDHIIPLAKGGADSPSNMQWQTKADAKAKDKWERK